MSAKPKAFFIQPPPWAREPNLAIAQLCAMVKRHGYEVEAIDLNIELCHHLGAGQKDLWAAEVDNLWRQDAFTAGVFEQNRSWIEDVALKPIFAAEKPVVCLAVTIPSIPAAKILTARIKERRPDALVLFGGQMFSMDRELVHTSSLWSCGLDAVVVGDGEETLLEALSLHGAGGDLRRCPGLWLRNGQGEPEFSGERPYLDLDSLPFADFTVFKEELYPKCGDPLDTLHGVVAAVPHIALMTSRGCVRRCSFCGHRQPWKGFRRMGGRRIYAEIAHQRRLRERTWTHDKIRIKFYDLILNGDMRTLSELCDLLIADPRPKIEWLECNAVIRPEMTLELCRKLYAAGCRWLIVGLESGSQRVLDAMDKGQTVGQMKQVLRNIDAAGLKVRGNFMFGHPGETEEDFQETLAFLREMHPFIHHVYPSYTMTHLEGLLLDFPQNYGVPRGQDEHFWRSEDGQNDYLVRLDRYRRFVEEAQALGANLITCLNMPFDAYLEFRLGEYYAFMKQPAEALGHYRKYLGLHGGNSYVLGRMKDLEAACPA